jgi:hypothetical protein
MVTTWPPPNNLFSRKNQAHNAHRQKPDGCRKKGLYFMDDL